LKQEKTENNNASFEDPLQVEVDAALEAKIDGVLRENVQEEESEEVDDEQPVPQDSIS